MKRFHVHLSVHDLPQSIRFYSSLFGAEPAVLKSDYAKWMLDDPRVNFAVSTRDAVTGVNHLGVQVDSGEELGALEGQLRAADATLVTESNAACCYARADKYWVTDPQGIAWETFHTLGSVPTFGGSASPAPGESAPSCTPSSNTVGACCA
jgi:catechol 2,3-dioxygenase-like lactoylglutathione lyase family enzyme